MSKQRTKKVGALLLSAFLTVGSSMGSGKLKEFKITPRFSLRAAFSLQCGQCGQLTLSSFMKSCVFLFF